VGIFVLSDIYKQSKTMSYIIPEHIQKMILEFEQNDINKIFVIGNTLTFFIKAGGNVTPVKLGIIDAPMDTGEQPKANLFFAKTLSDRPINLKNKIFMISQPNQDIKTGSFKVLTIGTEGKDGFVKDKSYKSFTFNNIYKVDARTNNGKLIDTYYTNDHDAGKDSATGDSETNAKQAMVVEFTSFINDLEQGDSVLLTLADKSTINLNFIDKKGEIAQFEIDKDSELSPNYKALGNSSSIEISTNVDDVVLNEKNKTLSVKAKAFHSVDGNLVPTDSTIDNITDWSPSDAISDNDDNDDEETDGSDGEKGTRDNRKEAKLMMQAILNDPIMKKAFYRQPTLWNIIMSTIKGENPRGTGIGPAKDIISKYGESRQIKRLGVQADNFKPGKKARFRVIYGEIVINPTGQPKDEIKLIPNKEYIADLLPRGLGSNDPYTLENKKAGYKIEVDKAYKDVADAFEVIVTKSIKSQDSEVKDYKKKGIIQFISQPGSGYVKKEIKKEPVKQAEPVNTTK